MSLTMPVRTAFTLSWTLTQADGTPINNANLLATLYAGRSLANPELVPGTTIPPIINTALSYVAASAGIYVAPIPATLDPAPDGTGYVLVFDADIGGNHIYHQEVPTVVETSGSVMDLTTVDQVKTWGTGLNSTTSEDAVIQSMITSWGFEFLRRTGLGDQGGDFTQSPFTAVCAWDEVYDGSGTNRLMLRNRPVKNVTSLMVNGIQIAASSGYPVQGYVIDGSKRSISMRGGILGWGNQLWNSWQSGPYHAFAGNRGFPRGLQNISIQYTAGYAVTPADIVTCANDIIFLTYKRRPWLGEKSRSVAGGGGSIVFDWDIPLYDQLIIDRYTRTL